MYPGTYAGTKRRDGYLSIPLQGKQLKMHRVIFFLAKGKVPGEIDHIDGCKSNNALSNLREVTRKQNSVNIKKMGRSKSGYTGVYATKDGKWVSQCRIDGISHYLGRFKNKEDAARQRDKFMLDYHPDHATTNFPRSEYQ